MDRLQRHNESWKKIEKLCLDNIERYRKGNAVIRLTDRQGNPVSGKSLRFVQTEHAFDFGCNMLMAGQMGDNNALYEQKITKLFNTVTTTLCWRDTETQKGVFRFEEGSPEVYRRPPADRVRRFAEQNSIRWKGQPLLADSWYPLWASRDAEGAKADCRDFFRAVAERYGDSLGICDVVNEAFLCKKRTPDFPLYNDDLDYVPWAFEVAQDLFPDSVKLEINEYTAANHGEVAQRYFTLIENILNMGIRVDSVGFQYHVFNGDRFNDPDCWELYDLQGTYGSYNNLCRLGLPMYITEVTMPSNIPDMSTEEGERVQAEVLEHLYTMWFSVPNMAGIIYWNLFDGAAWKGETKCLGCLLDDRLREKPSYQRIYQLVKRRWSTDECLAADMDGNARLRGFKGKYTVYDGEKILGNIEIDDDDKEYNFTV